MTIRDVPDEVRDELAVRAARAGQSLQEYVRAALVTSVSRPAVNDVIARARARAAAGAVLDRTAIVDTVHADRR